MFTLCQASSINGKNSISVAAHSGLPCSFEVFELVSEIERVKVDGKTTSTVYFSIIKTTFVPDTMNQDYLWAVKFSSRDISEQSFNNVKSAFKFAEDHAESTCAKIISTSKTYDKSVNSWIVSRKVISNQVEQLCTWSNPEDTLNPNANYAPKIEFSVTINGIFQGFHGNAVQLTRLIKSYISYNRSGITITAYNHRLGTKIELETDTKQDKGYRVLNKSKCFSELSPISSNNRENFAEMIDSQI